MMYAEADWTQSLAVQQVIWNFSLTYRTCVWWIGESNLRA